MNLSLLIHTCDNYLTYWPGMLYSLDFNWDFHKIPVYWASEELSVHEHYFECRGLHYKPDPSIVSILTGKTDKSGFSTRRRIALEKIPTKWVICLQEESWLISYPGNDVLEQLILFAETMKADSIKIHTKLHYYEDYRLEPTKFFINNTRILKFSEGENFLHSHNATIWNREYLLRHMVDSEDPWTNEVEGSKRMCSEQHNHFHYNIHWYSQPGVCEMGEHSRDFYTLAPIFDDRMSMKLFFEKQVLA